MSLAYPWILLLALPLIALLYYFQKKQVYRRRIAFPLLKQNFDSLSSKNSAAYIIFILRALTLILLLFALSRPQTSSTQSKRSSEGIDIMIAFDVSKSMLIEDVRGQSRIDIAKETTKEFIHRRLDDRIGFMMFAGESITLCPPTLDYEVLDSAIDAANTEQLKDGTAIGDAVANSVNRIKDSPAKSKIIVLLTDGDNNMGSIAPLTAGSLAKGYGIRVYSIALGKEGFVDLPVVVSIFGQERKEYQRVNSTINPELLMKISGETGGKFFRATEQDSLRKVLSEIDKLERTKVETKNRVRWEEHYQFPLGIALALLLTDFILVRTRFRVLPN